ncbi:MAG: thioesterase family protein [Pseudomonadota bacterium]
MSGETNDAVNFFEEVQTVRFQHCDPAGIVFYPRYYEMLNLTVERFFERQLDHSFNRLHSELSVTVPTVRIETDFLEASYLEDRLQFQMTLDRIGRSSLGFQIVCKCGTEDRLRAIITLVCIDFHAKKAVPWPDVIRAQIDAILAAGRPLELDRPDPQIVSEY